MTSYIKKNLGFNILKNNPFKACLNPNVNSNIIKEGKINTIKKNKNKIINHQKQNKSFITSPQKKKRKKKNLIMTIKKIIQLII